MASRQMPSDGALRVIVADDEPFARRLIKSALEQTGMIVIAEAKGGHEAIDGSSACSTGPTSSSWTP